jgi:hypothetical protein
MHIVQYTLNEESIQCSFLVATDCNALLSIRPQLYSAIHSLHVIILFVLGHLLVGSSILAA